MVLKTLHELRDLYQLRRIAEGKDGMEDATALEGEFITYSDRVPGGTLTVRAPKLYPLDATKQRQYHDAVLALRKSIPTEGMAAASAVDISGAAEFSTPLDEIILLSLRQLSADHQVGVRSYLNPLLETIYADGATLLRDFALNEALVGKVICTRGTLDLKDISLYPERFAPGPYTLSVTLDTPRRTVSDVEDLYAELDAMLLDPKCSMLNASVMNSVIERGLRLRETIGPVARYERPSQHRFTAQANSCVVVRDTSLQSYQFYLYAPTQGKNVVVSFGDAPMRIGRENPNLQFLDAAQWRESLSALISIGIFDPSIPVLEQRIEDISKFYDTAGRELASGAPEFKSLISNLKASYAGLCAITNPDVRRRYVMQQAPEIVEYMVCPSASDPVLYDLLPRLSWNKSLRHYHDTPSFIRQFSAADDEVRTKLLREVMACARLTTQQNNTVNMWLMQHHKPLCDKTGVQFLTVR